VRNFNQWLFELKVIFIVAALFFLFFAVWNEVASAELIFDKDSFIFKDHYYLYEDGSYFARLSWMPEEYLASNDILKLINCEIGLWLN
jgi:hypothetical protein